MSDQADDPRAVLDPARVRKLLDDLVHPSLALTQVLELSQRGWESADLSISEQKYERHRGGRTRERGGDEGPTRSVRRDDLRGARPTHSLPPLVCRLRRWSDSSADCGEVRAPRSDGSEATHRSRCRHSCPPSSVDRRGSRGSSRGDRRRSKRPRDRPRTWRRTHDGRPVTGTSSRSTKITVAHHEGGPADLDDVGSGPSITIAHHVGYNP